VRQSRNLALQMIPSFRISSIPFSRRRFLFSGGSYASKHVIYSPRDLFLMVTDDITEVADAKDEEFGLSRLQELLTRHATRALPEIWDLIMHEVRQFGPQQDDQSLLLLRVLAPTIPSRA